MLKEFSGFSRQVFTALSRVRPASWRLLERASVSPNHGLID